jgi:glycine cleavage system H lipoate-binding protein
MDPYGIPSEFDALIRAAGELARGLLKGLSRQRPGPAASDRPGKRKEEDSMNATNTETKTTTGAKEPNKPCVWWKAGVVPRQACEQRLEDCKGCPVDTALQKVAARRQKDFFPHDFFDWCYTHACAVPDRPCPFASPCMSNWSRTSPAASRVLTMLGVGTLALGVNASMIQQSSRRRGLHVDLVSRVGELKKAGTLGPNGKLTPANLGLKTVEQMFSLLAAAAFLDCLDTLDLETFAEALFTSGLAGHGLVGSVAEDRTGDELWDAFRAIQGLAILDVLATFDHKVLSDLQRSIASVRYGTLPLAQMALTAQRVLQPITRLPVRVEPGTAERAATAVGFAEALLGKTFEHLMVTPTEIGAGIIVGRVAKVVNDEAAAAAGRVLVREVQRAIAEERLDLPQTQILLSGIVASGCVMAPEERVALAGAVRQSFQATFQRVGNMAGAPVAFLAHLGTDNLIHEPDRFQALASLEASAAEKEAEKDSALLGVAMPQDLFYYGGHAWIRPATDGTVRIGLDDFIGRLIGHVDSVEMPRKGAHLRQGRTALRLVRGGEAVEIPSPIDGDVMLINRAVIDAPTNVATDPYGTGWLLAIKPKQVERDLPRLRFGEAAVAWQKSEVGRLREIAQGSMATAADGGTLAHDALSGIPGARWAEILAKFLKA